jgi:predicted dehydrogenase
MADISAVVTGFGSIGRRVLRNLRLLGVTDLTVYRTGRSTLSTEDELAGVTVEYNLDAALSKRPTAVFVVNPTARHVPTALTAARAGSHLLLEKPISHTLDGVGELRRVVADQRLVCLVGYQFRFHPGLLAVRRWLDEDAIGPVAHAQAHWGEYLPDWHPWEDYRSSYSAVPALGGGVTLTLSHPLDYLRWLLGDVAWVSATLGYGGLDIEAEDTADLQLGFASGVRGTVHLDYLQRPPSHTLRIVGRGGTITWDAADGVARCWRAGGAAPQAYEPPQGFERNDLFLDETRHFLACVSGTETPRCPLDDGIRVLELVVAAKRSATERRVITL